MSKLLITRGIPASGKTTLTRQMTAASDGTMKRICKDDLRLMMDTTSKFGLPHMAEYNALIRNMTYLLTSQGFDVILDETFMRASDIEQTVKHYAATCDWLRLPAELVILDLTKIPFEECILRDKARHPSLGYDVLLDYKETLEREGDTCTITQSLQENFGLSISVTPILSMPR